MKLMTFAEINDLENGQQVSSFQGTIKKVFDQKTGVGEYGPWHLQNIILQDDHANELTVTWSCEDPFDAGCEGTKYLFEAGRDKKDQLVGLKREIRQKNGKTYESVKVDDRAKVKTLSGVAKEPHQYPSDKGEHRSGGLSVVGEQKPATTTSPAQSDLSDPDWPGAPANAPQSPPARSSYATGPHYLPKPQNGNVLDQRQRAIIRQHSQSMAMEVLKLKVALNELTVVDLTPEKLKVLSDYFDADVLGAAE